MRYKQKLKVMGIPPDLSGVSIDDVTEVFCPFYAALLRKGDKERIVAVNGATGNPSKTVGHVLTTNLNYVSESLGRS